MEVLFYILKTKYYKVKTMAQIKTTEYLCSVDIETLGHSNSTPLLSIGFCHGTT